MKVLDLPIIKKDSLSTSDSLHKNSDAPLSDTHPNSKSANNHRQAAVLIPLVRQHDQWHLLFIRRASNEADRHSGQVAFPGGATEADDLSLIDTALRETQEEIGLGRDRINIIGKLEHYITISHFEVTPVVGIAHWPSNLKLESSEVARAFLIPLTWLRDRDNFTLRARSNTDLQQAQRHPIIVYNEYDGETLWGATARMTMNFIKAVDEKTILLPY